MRYFAILSRILHTHELSDWLILYWASSSLHYCLLVCRFLTYCPSKRILSDEGLKHEYFRESPLPIDPSMFPTWPAKSEQQRVKRGTSPRPPEGGLGYSQLVSSLQSTFSVTYTQQVFSISYFLFQGKLDSLPSGDTLAITKLNLVFISFMWRV